MKVQRLGRQHGLLTETGYPADHRQDGQRHHCRLKPAGREIAEIERRQIENEGDPAQEKRIFHQCHSCLHDRELVDQDGLSRSVRRACLKLRGNLPHQSGKARIAEIERHDGQRDGGKQGSYSCEAHMSSSSLANQPERSPQTRGGIAPGASVFAVRASRRLDK